MKRSCQ